MTERPYFDLFRGDSEDQNRKACRALDRAHEIRKFEIELYWKRAAYFWVFIAALFAAFGALFPFETAVTQPTRGSGALFPFESTETETPHSIARVVALYIVGGLGFLASMAWYFANRGSKYWQENWEAHVDALEDCIEGPLYKTILNRKSPWDPLGPYPFSVSRINIGVSFLVAVSWLILLIFLPFLLEHPAYKTQAIYLAIGVPLFSGSLGLWFGRCVTSSSPGKSDERRSGSRLRLIRLWFERCVRGSTSAKPDERRFTIRNVSTGPVDDPRTTADES